MKYILTILLTIFLSSCGTTTKLSNSKSIKATDKSNIAFLALGLSNLDHRVKRVRLSCLNIDTNKVTWCFPTETNLGSTYYVGASPYSVKFGNYKIIKVVYTLLLSTTVTEKCTVNDGKKEDCQTTEKELTSQKSVDIELDDVFTVSATQSPYIGRLNVVTNFDAYKKPELIKAEIVKDFEADLMQIEDSSLKDTLRKHVNQYGAVQ